MKLVILTHFFLNCFKNPCILILIILLSAKQNQTSKSVKHLHFATSCNRPSCALDAEKVQGKIKDIKMRLLSLLASAEASLRNYGNATESVGSSEEVPVALVEDEAVLRDGYCGSRKFTHW